MLLTADFHSGIVTRLLVDAGLVGQRVPTVTRAVFALILLFVMVVSGLVIVNVLKRSIRRHGDSGRRPKPFEGPPSDDWARKPMVSAEPEATDLESSDFE